ncbi:protease complex subunit PrcB family protein [Flavobacterium sp. MAH-1]|uniref:Protease complex subunit PrcB family protein n=1 Tax=Flavobacterium agri TaxID=2743471 RepID=A0A7Y9C690_9FLAO|nr:protease complex subunit PrcB family protein [Flavobacterium agri]NUY79967.1 protease complex subunit PrcB family protein [Flavobacterium agri]NYA69992.1 protease complex subunit PrcB family protein [Flavobacterium agri]
MRKIATAALLVFLAACSSAPKSKGEKPIYEVLTSQSDGGGNIHFFEILTTPEEIKMLQADENLRKKISASDLDTANFIILNMGEKNTGGYAITVDKVEEKPDKIVVTVKETEPKSGDMTVQVITYPYAIIKINSKKPIEIK